MKVTQIIGADLSKKTIDFATAEADHIKVSNNSTGYQQLMEWLKRQSIDLANMMIVMEHTGLYSYRFEQFCHLHHIQFCKVSALAIKRSMGIVRGKNDKIDAIRIARYGVEKRQTLVAHGPVDQTLHNLQLLYSTRERLVRHRAALITAIKEYQDNCDLKKTNLLIQSQSKLVKCYDQQIRELDEAIAASMQHDRLRKNYQLLTSVIGVGKIVALAIIIKTGNFTRFTKARKFACYCGTAPFENSSGSSIRGRTKISHLADKHMKTLLDLAAKSAIQYDKELREYYLRRINAGKSKMSTINIVRNKILYRMFAVINRQTPFINDYLQSA